MNKPRTRSRFMPRFGVGAERDAVNARFQREALQYSLLWRCPDCCYLLSNGICSQGWPNDFLVDDDVVVLDPNGAPLFCKAFEAQGH